MSPTARQIQSQYRSCRQNRTQKLSLSVQLCTLLAMQCSPQLVEYALRQRKLLLRGRFHKGQRLIIYRYAEKAVIIKPIPSISPGLLGLGQPRFQSHLVYLLRHRPPLQSCFYSLPGSSFMNDGPNYPCAASDTPYTGLPALKSQLGRHQWPLNTQPQIQQQKNLLQELSWVERRPD
ncbi:hypothetical protein MP228_005712 [Amoeboaphelidium protococcarum]|nr:hypothetical protein MP228_005712 [Amoeboaphelidium protococcarum]